MGQLGAIGRVIYNKLEQWVRNPECIWGWLVKKRNDLKTSGRNLTIREIYSYFGDCSNLKNRISADVIKRHCPTVEFMGDLEEPIRDTSQGKFSDFLKRSEDLLNSDAIEREFAGADVYDGSSISLTSGKNPGSRGITDGNNDRRQGKGVGWKCQREENCEK